MEDEEQEELPALRYAALCLLAACAATPGDEPGTTPSTPSGQPAAIETDAPDLHVTEYAGRDDDNLSIPTAAWLHGPWMVDVISLEGADLEWYGIDDIAKLHWVVLTLEPQGFRLQSMKPPFEVYAEGKTRYEPQGNGEFHLHFTPGGTVEASRFGLTLFLNGDDVPWHVWERPSADPRWMPAREAHAAEMQDSEG